MPIDDSNLNSAAGVNKVQITPRFYACRDATRLLLGQCYATRMSDVGNALLDAARAADCNVLDAARAAARGIEGLDAMQLFAAAVEILEPST